MKTTLWFILLSFITLSAQQFTLKGKVESKITGETLSYASIRIDGTSSGTTSNREGIYEFKLKAGSNKLIASYIGYTSDTLKINLQKFSL